MSKRPHSVVGSTSSAHENRSQALQPTQTSAPSVHSLQRTVSASQLGPFAEPQRPSHGPPSSLELPPLARTNPASPGSFAASAPRIAGVSSILNPQVDEAHAGQRRKASHLASPVASGQQLPPLAPSIRNPSGTGGQHALSPRSSRRILTPRSPSGLHRVASLGQINPQAGSINAQQTPFPPSPRRVHTIEPGTPGVPPLPTLTARSQVQGHGFPAPLPPQGETSRRASTGTARARNLSPSASPSTSYSSYSQSQTSPVGPYASAVGATLLPAYSSGAEAQRSGQRTASDPTLSDTQRQMGVPISSSGGQNVYQMMTLETTSGTVQLPVDVQAASRVADEKRRRNAGASARFRQRRKEKEKEASTSISRLEQQVKEVTEDAEFYRTERANLLSLLRGVPGMEHQLQRPPSPRQIRARIGSMPQPMMRRRTSYMPPPGSEPQSPQSGRNVRRRTSTFSLPAAPSSQLPQPSPLQPNYPPSGYTTPIAPQPPTGPLPSPSAPLQRPFGQQQAPPPPPPSVMQAHPQTGPYNPYERRYPETSPREGR